MNKILNKCVWEQLCLLFLEIYFTQNLIKRKVFMKSTKMELFKSFWQKSKKYIMLNFVSILGIKFMVLYLKKFQIDCYFGLSLVRLQTSEKLNSINSIMQSKLCFLHSFLNRLQTSSKTNIYQNEVANFLKFSTWG